MLLVCLAYLALTLSRLLVLRKIASEVCSLVLDAKHESLLSWKDAC